VGDHVFLLLWLHGYSPLAMPVYLEKILRTFPFSRLSPEGTFRIQAVSFTEPPVREEVLEDVAGAAADLIEESRQVLQPDSALQIECWWDLWRREEDWGLRPSPVDIHVYGPEFEREQGEQVRIDAGPETLYVPDASKGESLRPAGSNVRSLVRLAGDLESALFVERRVLVSESGVNLAERIREAL
jgi:hypothetical protein